MSLRPLTFLALVAGFLLGPYPAIVSGKTPPVVPVAADLAADARLARARGLPILLIFTREGCSYCELLKTAVMEPVIMSGDYEVRAIIREVVIDSGVELVDFAGRRVSPFSIADRYDALLTPTVLIVGPDAAELSERLVGINNVDMYLWYLDKAVAEGAAELAAGGPREP